MLASNTRVLALLVCGVGVACGQTCISSSTSTCPSTVLALHILPPLNSSTLKTFRKTVEEVSMTFSVTDRKGRAVRGLEPAEVTVIEDDHRVTMLTHFSYAEAPLRVGVLVDGSDSVADQFELERQTAAEFLRNLMRPGFDEGFVVGFGAKPEVLRSLTGDTAQMISALEYPIHDRQVTAVYDAIIAACSGEMARPAAGEVRRAIVLLSDGEDNYSMSSLSDAIAAAQRADTAIYVVTTRGRHWDQQEERALEELTEGTGGRAYVLGRPTKYLAAFNAIEQELRSSYTVSFKPLNQHDGQFHPVQIALRDASLRVHARRGYFAPQQ